MMGAQLPRGSKAKLKMLGACNMKLGQFEFFQTVPLGTVDKNKKEMADNAQRIIHAFNEYPKLVEALQYYVDNCNHNPCDCLQARLALMDSGGVRATRAKAKAGEL